MEIRFAKGETELGTVAVACSEKGVCAIVFEDGPDSLARCLEEAFPGVPARFAPEELAGPLLQVEQLIACPGSRAGFAIDVVGTPFQQRVWEALQQIPAGHTVTYKELAWQLGMPGAARAVGAACAANRIAVAIPCHRVLRADGSLSGYRWGVERKKLLLLRERAVTHPLQGALLLHA